MILKSTFLQLCIKFEIILKSFLPISQGFHWSMASGSRHLPAATNKKEENWQKKDFHQFKFSYGKGQIISEQKCGVLNFPKMQRNYC